MFYLLYLCNMPQHVFHTILHYMFYFNKCKINYSWIVIQINIDKCTSNKKLIIYIVLFSFYTNFIVLPIKSILYNNNFNKY